MLAQMMMIRHEGVSRLTLKVPVTSDNYCRLLCHLLVILKVIFANSVDPDQTAPLRAV